MNPITKSLLEFEVIEALRQVYDPELPLNIYDLGLIYDIRIDDDSNVHLVMTLTSPNCPVAESLPQEVQEAAAKAPGVKNVTLELTWDPPFSIEMMSDEAKLALGLL